MSLSEIGAIFPLPSYKYANQRFQQVLSDQRGSDETGAAVIRMVLESRQKTGGAVLFREMRPNEVFKIHLQVDDGVNMDAASYQVHYDPAVLRLAYDPDILAEQPVVTAGVMDNDQAVPLPVWNDDGQGIITLAQSDIPGSSETGNGVSLAVLHFLAKSGTARSQTAISFQGGVVSHQEDASPMLVDLFDTSVWSTPVYSGDTNDDGVVNALDIVKIKGIIVGLDEMTAGADANHDSLVNALDLTTTKLIYLQLLR